MKRTLNIILCSGLILGMSGCASFKSLTHSILPHKPSTSAAAVTLPPYSGPKAKITLTDFEVKAAKANTEVGVGLRELLLAALINSNRFLPVERQSAEEIANQKEPPSSGAQQETSLIITVTVTEFEPQASGGKAGIGGGGGGAGGLLGGLLGAPSNKAYIALEVRIADTSTSQVLAVNRIQGQAADISANAAGLSLGKGLSVYTNTPMEKAIRTCVMEAVRYISQAIPAGYYKY